MSKLIFVGLLLANALLFAYHRGYFDAGLPDGREPARMANQLNADKLKLIPEGASRAASASASAQAAAQTASADADAASNQAGKPGEKGGEKSGDKSADKSSESIACVEVGNFEPADARRFEARLNSFALGDRLTRRNIQEVARHMVYIPPLGGKDAADKKAAELRKLGLTDFFVIQDGTAMRWGISLGIFKTEEAARAHLAALSQKGVRSARLGTQNATSNKLAFRLLQIDATTKAGLDLIKADFPNQELRSCEAEHTN